jgi:hypothetical protein
MPKFARGYFGLRVNQPGIVGVIINTAQSEITKLDLQLFPSFRAIKPQIHAN